MLKGKKRTVSFFAVIYIVFGVMLFYLFYFNTGLEFVKVEKDKEMNLYLTNSSIHLIRNISVIDDDGKEVALIKYLLPKEKQLITFEKKKAVELEAKALFHVPIKIAFSLGVYPTGDVVLNYNTNYPQIVLLNEDFIIKVEVCAKENEAKGVEVFPQFDKEMVEFLDKKSAFLDVEKDSCKEAEFKFSALKKGVTTITFNIKAQNSVKKVDAKITIIGTE